jgi:hypothetical protein
VRRRRRLVDGGCPPTADALTLEANHYFFEEILNFGSEAQRVLAQRYRDAFAVMDAVGWRRPEEPLESVDVPITAAHAEQLFMRRYELGYGNIDRLAIRDAEPDKDVRAEIDSAIAIDREAAMVLDRLVGQVRQVAASRA